MAARGVVVVTAGGGGEAAVELGGGLAAAVAVGAQPGAEALLGQPGGAGGGGEPLQEPQRDRAVEVAEQADGAGEHDPQVGAELVGDRDTGLDEVLAGPDMVRSVTVAGESGSRVRQRCPSVRRQSAST